jgi:hypothetical protein
MMQKLSILRKKERTVGGRKGPGRLRMRKWWNGI